MRNNRLPLTIMVIFSSLRDFFSYKNEQKCNVAKKGNELKEFVVVVVVFKV